MFRGKERKKKEQIHKVKQRQVKKIYIKINCKGKRTVGKAYEGINVEKSNRFKKLYYKKRKEKERKKKEKKKRKKTHRTAKAQRRGSGL